MAEHEDGGNGYNGEQIKDFLERIADIDDELASLRGEYMANCKPLRARIRDVLTEVKDASVNVTAFKQILEAHRLTRKHDARVDELENDDRDAYQMLVEALGEFAELPLGKSALDRARPSGDDAIDELTR